MTDRSSAYIIIGGELPALDFLVLAGLIRAESLSADWDGPWFTPDDHVEGQPLSLKAREVTGGQFDELEAWCEAHGLPFVRWCAAYPGSWAAERVVFTGEGEPVSYISDDDDRVLIDAARFESLGSMEAVRAHFAAGNFIVPPLVIIPHNPEDPTPADPAEGAGHPHLTDDQHRAVEAFAKVNGEGDAWREALSMAWAQCSEPEPWKASLRAVRNLFGPSWLFDAYAWGWLPQVPPFEKVGDWSGRAPKATPGFARWSADFDPPAIGARVWVRTNSLGEGVVTGYFVMGEWLGVIVKLADPAAWYVKKNGGNVPGHSFGAEIDLA